MEGFYLIPPFLAFLLHLRGYGGAKKGGGNSSRSQALKKFLDLIISSQNVFPFPTPYQHICLQILIDPKIYMGRQRTRKITTTKKYLKRKRKHMIKPQSSGQWGINKPIDTQRSMNRTESPETHPHN